MTSLLFNNYPLYNYEPIITKKHWNKWCSSERFFSSETNHFFFFWNHGYILLLLLLLLRNPSSFWNKKNLYNNGFFNVEELYRCDIVLFLKKRTLLQKTPGLTSLHALFRRNTQKRWFVPKKHSEKKRTAQEKEEPNNVVSAFFNGLFFSETHRLFETRNKNLTTLLVLKENGFVWKK